METLTLLIVIILIVGAFLCFRKSKLENYSKLTYLKQYEDHDWYRNNPSIWPVVEIPPTVKYQIERPQGS